MARKPQPAPPVAAFKALSNATRLKVFEIIRAGFGQSDVCRSGDRPADIPPHAVCVCEILALLDVTGPTLSHHLKELRNAGLVDVYQRGQWAYYAARQDAIEALARYFQCSATAPKITKSRKGVCA